MLSNYYLIIFLLTLKKKSTLNKSSYPKPCSLGQQRAQILNAARAGLTPHVGGWGGGTGSCPSRPEGGHMLLGIRLKALR